jgi:hypothetical protein
MQDQGQKWRNEIKSEERPTVHCVVICAEDEIDRWGIHCLVICHVRSLDGDGFMPSIRVNGGGGMRNGEIHLGKDEAAYAKAKDEGTVILEKENVEAERRFQESLALTRQAQGSS